jgi:DNA-binding Lrp family transcriptional regulator
MVHLLRIDMRLTDDRVLSVIKGRLGAEWGELTFEEIARAVPCHPQTVLNAIRRLEAANRLRSKRPLRNRACTYQVLE